MKFYRYEIVAYEDGPRIFLWKFNLVKETPKGYWISMGKNDYKSKDRWVSKTSKKRYAYPTLEEAKVSFRARTKRRISILEAQVRHCQLALGIFEKENFKPTNV